MQSPATTLVDLLRRRAHDAPGRDAFTFLADGEREAGRITRGELDRAARAVGAALRAAGCAGRPVLLLFPQGLEFVTAFWGCLYGGAVAVPAYPPRGERGLPRLRAMCHDARPAAVLTTAALRAEVRPFFGAGADAMAWIAVDELPEGIEEGWAHPGGGGDALAFLQYTSGSTGTPRGVMVSHANLLHNLRLLAEGWAQGDDAVVVSWLPLFHDMGLIGNVLEAVHLGAPCVLMPPAAFLQRPLRWLGAVSRYGATLSGGPNFAYELAARRTTAEERAGLDLSRWSAAFNGAEPVRADTVERFYQAFAPCGLRREALRPGYGLAEATLVVSSGRAPGAPPRAAAFDAAALEEGRLVERAAGEAGTRALVGCGRIVGGQEVAIVDPETRRGSGPGRVGEIWVRGPSVAGGYWGRPEETEETFRALRADTGEGPFLRTGDLGFVHAGELFVAGRAKDLVIVRGRNHYPQDLELTAERADAALRPGCGAAFTVEAEDGERLVLVAEVERTRLRADLAPAAAAIRQALVEEHELPVHRVVLIRPGAIPKTTSGKIQRRACRAALLAGELAPVLDWTAPAGSSDADLAIPPSARADAEQADSSPGPSPEAVRVREWLVARIARHAGVAPAEVDPRAPFARWGVDSLAALALSGELEEWLGHPLPPMLLYDHPSPDRVARALADGCADAAGDVGAEDPVGGVGETEHPLSHGQRAMWLLGELEPASPLFNLFTALRMTPAVDAAVLRRALDALVERHPALRTALVSRDGRPVQVVEDGVAVNLPETDAAGWSGDALRRALEDEAHRPFALDRAPLLRAALYRRGPEEDVLLLAMHHAAVDFWSCVLLLGDLAALYDAGVRGEPAALAPPGAPYTAWARRQERRLAGAEGERLWAYWRHRLAGATPQLALPADRRPAVRTGAGAVHRFRLDGALARRIDRAARECGATPFVVLLAAWQALLGRWTGQDEVLVATPMAARGAAAWEATVGCFMNLVPLRGDLSGAPGFCALLERTREEVQGALRHQEYPLHLLAERLPALRGSGRGEPAQAMFVFNRPHRLEAEGIAGVMAGEPGARFQAGAMAMEALPLDERATPCDLCLWACQADGGWSMRLQYDAERFDPATAARLADQLATLLGAALGDPARPLDRIPLLTPAERAGALAESAGGAATDLPRLPVHTAFEARAALTPNAIAVEAGGETLTYAELDARANRLAHHLLALGVAPDEPVAVCLERSPELVAALLAVLKAGAGYLPLDPAWPEERLERLLEGAGARVLVARGGRVPAGAPIRAVRVDADAAAIASRPSAAPGREVDGGMLAYLIHTSGSTGTPKGVMVPHGALANHTASAIDAYGLDAGDRVLQFAPASFDASAEEIFPALAAGAALVLRPEWASGSAADFLAFCAEARVTVLDLPTAFWHPLAAALAAGEAVLPPSVRLVIIGGERALPERVAEWQAAVGERCALVNTYGPTEGTIVATRHWIAAGDGDACEVPIGRPIHGVSARVLDVAGEPVPPGVVGELYLGGAGVARGYRGRPAQTAERFVPDPHAATPGARMYATGDRARVVAGGALAFAGRVDGQVKVRGFRIEPGEVEAVLREHPDVADVAVAAPEWAPGERRLAAYVVPRRAPAPAARELREFAAELLPGHMVPSAWVFLSELPRTPGGKVDRRALPLPGAAPADAGAGVPPRTPVERVVAEVWAAVLGRERVGVHDDFFALGGDSILAMQVVSRARAAGLPMHPWQMFAHTTVARLAAAVEAAETPVALPLPPEALVPLRAGPAEPVPA